MQPEVIRISTELDGEAEAQIYGKRKDNWVRTCLYAATLSAVFVGCGYLFSWLGLPK